MTLMNFSAPAGVFEQRSKRAAFRAKLKFQRFDTLAEAVKYVVEGMPKGFSMATVESEGQEFSYVEVQELYRSRGYPLSRAAKP